MSVEGSKVGAPSRSQDKRPSCLPWSFNSQHSTFNFPNTPSLPEFLIIQHTVTDEPRAERGARIPKVTPSLDLRVEQRSRHALLGLQRGQVGLRRGDGMECDIWHVPE